MSKLFFIVGLGTVLVVSLVLCASQPALTHPALAAADLPIYTDALAGGWQDWSWDTTRSFDNAQPVHSGSASIAITYTTAWAGFYLTGTALPASDYTAIRFWVHGGGTGGQSVNFHLDAGDSYPFTVQANTWLSVTIPFAALGNPITLSALIWQDNSGSDLGQPTIYLDDISLIGGPPDIGTWSAVTSPVTCTLRSVSMLSANDGWAVGYEGYYDNGIPKGSAILRRNGNMWNEWGSDSSGPALFAVTTVSDTDGWAAGSDSGDGSATLRWNGSAWNSVTHPSGQRLYSVAMVSADDGWAVGGGGRCDPGLRLTGTIMRWDGSAWSADSILDRVLYSVAMVSANDGWAVGYYCRYLGGYPIPTWDTNSVVMRWNGSSWNEISPPTYQTLDSVAMVSATDGWAVGILGTIMHWNGSSWSWSRSPTSCNLRSVSMVSADDGWAVGGGGANCPSQPSVILHWNGIAWGEIVSPVSQTLNSVAMTSANEGWAVGDAGTILHYTNLKNLNVNKTGTGSGTVTSSPAGIDCGATCSASFDYNTSVTLTATATTGSTFTGWSGSGCSDTGICTVNMDAAKSVSANFTQNEYTLTITYLPLCAKNYCPGQFFDDFTNPDSGWGAWENSEYKFGILNGEFQIVLKNTDSGFWDTPSLVLPSDYVMEVDARHATTNLGNYSLMFGARIIDNDPVEFYRFVVYPGSQEYFMEKYNNGTWTTLIDWTYDSRINYGMAMNHLMVKRVGTSISVGVNSWLNTVYDGEFTSAGRDGGLEVFSHASAPTDMRFDNFLVTCPQ